MDSIKELDLRFYLETGNDIKMFLERNTFQEEVVETLIRVERRFEIEDKMLNFFFKLFCFPFFSKIFCKKI